MRLYIEDRSGWKYARGTGPDGRPIRKSLGTKDTRRAEEALAKLESKLWKANVYGAKAVITFDQAALAYAEDGGETRFLIKMTEQLSGVPLHSITPQMVRSAAKKAYPAGATSTHNRQGITPTQAVINYAHQQGWCGPIRVKRFPETKPLREAVGIEYLFALERHAPINLFALMVFLHTTGRRVGDAISLKPTDVDFSAAEASIAKTKNGDPAKASLVPALLEIIKSLPPYPNGRLFGYKNRSGVYNTLKRSCKEAGIKYLATHQVGRHSFATNLYNTAGWDGKRIADAGGWKSPRLVEETYIHSNNKSAEAAELIWTKSVQGLRAVK